MANIISLNLLSLLLLLLLLIPFSSAAHNPIRGACKVSRNISTCRTLLSGLHNINYKSTSLDVINSALSLTADYLDQGRTQIIQVVNASTQNQNWTNAAHNCLDLLDFSDYRLNQTVTAVRATKPSLKDARAWLSAVVGYEYSCWSSLRYVGANKTAEGLDATDFFNSTLIPLTSIALGMVSNYDIYGPRFGNWSIVKTERDGFWERLPSSPQSGWVNTIPRGLPADATVCKSGCRYKTVQEAVNAAPNNSMPGNRFVIQIKAGVYQETVQVPFEKKNLLFSGDGIGKTVITWNNSVGLTQGMTTYVSATVGVAGDGFMACNLTINNTAGAGAYQAVALRVDSDQSVLEDCEFLGNQDTLFAVSLRQFYKSCTIQGNVDFIFGNSASIFQDCTILIAPRVVNPSNGQNNSVTAHGRTDPAQSTGFVFINSTVRGTKEYMDYFNKNFSLYGNFLGRPWKEYSRTVFIKCYLDKVITDGGWMEWKGDFALNTLYYSEFKNSGPGSKTKRVPWSSQIPAEHVASYTPQNFIQAY